MKTLDIGIINYNGGDCLSECIKSLLEMTGVDVSVYVFDNKSTDQSVENAEKKYPQCKYIRSNENLGYAGGCNELIKVFTSDIVAVCNMDLEFSKDWAERIIDCFNSDSSISSVASMVVQKENNELYASDIHFFWDLHPICITELSSPEPVHQVFGAYGAVMTFRKNVFDKIGMFDDDYFLFFEETEFFLRMNVNNLKVALCQDAKVYHHRSVSTIKYSTLKLHYSERNRIWTALKYLPYWYLPLLPFISALRFYKMSKSGVPKSDGAGKKVRLQSVLFTIVKAWFFSMGKVFRELHKRRSIWKKSQYSPSYTLSIIKKYPLKSTDLRIR